MNNLSPFQTSLLAAIPTGRNKRTTVGQLINVMYDLITQMEHGRKVLDLEIRQEIHKLKAAGHPVCTTRAGVWLAESPEEMEQSYIQRIRHGASEIAAVRKEIGSPMFSKLIGQLELTEVING